VSYPHQFIATIICTIIGLFSYWKKSISISGLLGMLTVSLLFIATDEIQLLLILFYMFASSSILGKVFPQDSVTSNIIAKHGPRDYIQAIANLGVATVLFLLYIITNNSIFIIGMISSIIAANADSWASEIGGTSTQTPRLITTFQTVQKGVSGGITLKGTLAGVLGGFFILTLSYFTVKPTIQASIFSLVGILAMLFGGLSGLFIDSYLGAWFQALYIKEGVITERPGNTLVKGFKWVNNDAVNFLSTLSASVIGMLIFLLKD